MKYKILSVLAVIGVLAGAVALHFYEPPHNRYHQHMEARQYTPCTDHGDDVFCTHLPLMSITTDGPMPDPFLPSSVTHTSADRNYERVGATVSLFDSHVHNNHLTDSPVIESRALIRTRGASSRHFAKKGYALKFCQDDMTVNRSIPLFGMPADEDWALHGPFLDKTLVRNYLCYNLSGEIMDYAPEVRFFELFLNGEYEGLYLAVEKNERGSENRIQLTKSDPRRNETSFIGVIDRGASDPLHSLTPFSVYLDMNGAKLRNKSKFEILYPGETLTQGQHDYIEQYISQMERALYSFDYRDSKKGFHAYIDEQSFIDYFIINEFTANDDAMVLSTYFYKDSRGKMKLAVWDFNATYFYNLDRFYKYNSLWYHRMLKDEKFNRAMVDRYFKLRKSVLSDAYLLQYIDDTLAWLGPAVERNTERWNDSYQSRREDYNMELQVIGKDAPLWNHAQAVQQLKDAIVFRGRCMDAYMEQTSLLSHNSVNKKNNYTNEAE